MHSGRCPKDQSKHSHLPSMATTLCLVMHGQAHAGRPQNVPIPHALFAHARPHISSLCVYPTHSVPHNHATPVCSKNRHLPGHVRPLPACPARCHTPSLSVLLSTSSSIHPTCMPSGMIAFHPSRHLTIHTWCARLSLTRSCYLHRKSGSQSVAWRDACSSHAWLSCLVPLKSSCPMT